MSVENFESWAVLELMGHVRTAGRVTEEERFGSKVGRIDIPTKDGGFVTTYFTALSIYRLTACSEEAARAVAISNAPEPVHTWELPAPEKGKEAAESEMYAERTFDDDEPEDDDMEF